MGIKIYAGETLRPLGHSKDWQRLWNFPEKGAYATSPSCFLLKIPFPRAVDFMLSWLRGERLIYADFESIPSSAATVTTLSSELQQKPKAGTVSLSSTWYKVSITLYQ